MSASPWPGWLVLAAIAAVAVGCVLYAVSGAIALHRVLRARITGRAVRPAQATWVVERRSPVSWRWGTWGGPYGTEAQALADYTETIADPDRGREGFRVVAICTTYQLTAQRLPQERPCPATTGGGRRAVRPSSSLPSGFSASAPRAGVPRTVPCTWAAARSGATPTRCARTPATTW